MVKAWCIWCESGSDNDKLKSGYYWIHMDCAQKLMDYGSDVKSVREILQGIHPRNKKDEDKLNVVFEFIKDMEDFRRKWEGTMKIINAFQSNSASQSAKAESLIRAKSQSNPMDLTPETTSQSLRGV